MTSRDDDDGGPESPPNPPGGSESPRARAAESISARFTRTMNATTSAWGIVGVATAPAFVALLVAIRVEAAPGVITALEVVAALPLAVAVMLSLALLGARGRVIDWLAGLPFPLENVNALLNGVGETLEITFQGKRPADAELNGELDHVSEDCFVADGAADGPRPWVEVRIGVVDSKRNPAASNHRRYQRVRALVSRVLVPLSRRFPIAEVRVK
jgi:hypothetical protein